jgi:WD40 repeat protein
LFGTFTFDPGFIGYLRFDGAGGVHGTAIPGTKNMLVTTYPRNGGGVGPAEVIDAVSGATVVELDPMIEGPIAQLEFSVSSTGQFAAERALPQSGVGSVAAVFDLSTGKIVSQKISLPDFRESAAINATGTRLAVGSDELGGVTVYDTVSGRVVASLVGLPDAPPVSDDGYDSAASVAYGPDGRLYVGSSGEHLRVLDPTTFAVTADITVPAYSTTGLMRFGEDGVTLIDRSVHVDHGAGVGSLIRIDLATGSVAWRVTGTEYANGECGSFAFSVVSNQLWCGDFFGRVRERSVRSGARTGRVLQNQKGWVSDLDLIDVPGGALLVGVSNNDGVISRWMVDGGGPIQRLVARGRLIVGAFPDGKTLLVGTNNGNDPPLNLNYTLWDTDTDTEVPGMPTMLFANVMGDAIEGLFPDFKIGSYDLQTKHVAEIPISLPPIPEAVTSSADGTMLALGFDDGSADEYDSRTGAHLLHLQIPLRADGSQGDISALAISADHHRVYASGGGLTVFDGSTGRVLAQNPDGAIANVGVSPLGLVVATSVDGTIGVYDGETLVKLSSLPGARGYVQNIFFSADGTTMIGAGNDGSVSVYDLPSGTRIGDAIDMDRGDRSPTALRADGTMVAIETASDDGVELWDLDPSHLVAAACTIAGRNLTREEWATYIGDLGDYAATCSDYPIPT